VRFPNRHDALDLHRFAILVTQSQSAKDLGVALAKPGGALGSVVMAGGEPVVF
jgi:hypothetical protein